jgi:glycerophosphoryl diester phosphodiesterase
MKKAISHRARGTKFKENTLNAIKEVAKEDFFMGIEVDVRFSDKNIPYIYHDPLPSINNHKLTKLEDFLVWWAENDVKNKKLFLDIKDIGFEKEILDLLEKYHIQNVEFISLSPQTIKNFYEEFKKRNYTHSLYLNYLRADTVLSSVLRFLLIFKKVICVRKFIFVNQDYWQSIPSKYNRGYIQVPVFKSISEDLITILRETKGGVCIPWHFNNNYFKKYKNQNLKIYIYGGLFGKISIIIFKWQYNLLAKNEDVDLIACDSKMFITKNNKLQ